MAIEVKKYKNTGIDYILGTNKVLFRQGGVIALVSDFREWDAKNIVMSQVLGLSGDPKCSGYDFAHAAKTGQLRRRQHTDTTDESETPIPHAPIPSAAPPLANHAVPPAVEPVQEPAQEPQEEVVPEAPTQEEPEYFLPMVVPQPAQKAEAQPKKPGWWKRLSAKIGERVAYQRQVRETRKEQKQYAEMYKEPSVKQKKKHAAHAAHSSPDIMLGVILIVGIGALIMSAYHILTYMYDGGRPQWIAIMTGIIMTLFSAIAFTAARHFYNTKKLSGFFIGTAFVSFGVIVIAFAMFSTIKVNYDQFKAGDEQKIAAAVSTSSKVTEASTRMAFVKAELDRLDAAIKVAQAEATKWSRLWTAETNKGDEANADLTWRYWSAKGKADTALKTLQDQRTPYATEYMSPTNTVSAVEDQVKQEAKDATVFGMFAKLFGIAEDTLKFIVYIIPAVFYDLMCPFALTVSFILIDMREETIRKEEEEDERHTTEGR